MTSTVISATWGLSSDHGDGRGTNQCEMTPRAFLYFCNMSVCLLTSVHLLPSYLRLYFSSPQPCSFWRYLHCLFGPRGGISLGHRCRKLKSTSYSRYSSSFYKHWAPPWDLLSQVCCPALNQSSCNPWALNQAETWRSASNTL